MAAFASLALTGANAFTEGLRALPEAVRPDALVDGLTRAAEPMRARMATLSPRGPDAPHIADHIVVSRLRQVDGVKLTDQEAAVGIGPAKEYFYGWFWEFGWKFHPTPHPFVRPAFDAEADRAQALLAGEIENAIKRASRGVSTSGGGLL